MNPQTKSRWIICLNLNMVQVSLVYKMNLMMPIIHMTKIILHFAEGFIQMLVKTATSFSVFRNIIQFTKWWYADNFSGTCELL